MSSSEKHSNRFSSILLRATVLAFCYAFFSPILKSAWAGWSSLAGNFPGYGPWPHIFSAVAFVAAFVVLGWVLGTKPVRWLKKGAGRLWRYLVLKRFSALENGEDGKSWRGKEVAYAEQGRFGARETAPVWSLGVVTADYGEWVGVFLITPPGGTSRLIYVRKNGDLIWPTGRSIKNHAETFVTIGNGVNPQDFLPESGHP